MGCTCSRSEGFHEKSHGKSDHEEHVHGCFGRNRQSAIERHASACKQMLLMLQTDAVVPADVIASGTTPLVYFFDTMFRNLFAERPDLTQAFSNFHTQCRMLAKFMTSITKSVTKQRLHRLVDMHTALGVPPDAYVAWFDVFKRTAKQILGDKFTENMRAGCEEISDLVLGIMVPYAMRTTPQKTKRRIHSLRITMMRRKSPVPEDRSGSQTGSAESSPGMLGVHTPGHIRGKAIIDLDARASLDDHGWTPNAETPPVTPCSSSHLCTGARTPGLGAKPCIR